MATVKCKLCAHQVDGYCTAKKPNGRHSKRKLNKNRSCTKFSPNPVAFAKEYDKAFEKEQIPRFSPTWRYYASKKELIELGEQEGNRFVRINP